MSASAASAVSGVHQVLATFHPGDAMGNEALAIQALLRRSGLAAEIFAETRDARMARRVRPLREYAQASSRETVCLFHFSAGGAAARLLARAPDRLIVLYHNVTPARFFLGFDDGMARESHEARRVLSALAPRCELALAKSEFSRRELDEAGFRRTGVLPFVLDLERFARPAAPAVRRLFGDGRTNLLFVGRIVPNKKIDDLIRVFAVYRRHLDRRSRLLLVGDHRGQDRYLFGLAALARQLRVADDVVFTGHVDEDELIACYLVADAFLCLSEHEGFGVPLLEAMHFGIPVLAYDAAAVAETLRGGGVLLKDKSPELVAELLGRLRSDRAFRAAVLATQERAIREVRATDYGALLMERLSPVLGPGGEGRP